MTLLHVLPHTELCPQGATIDAEPGTSICDAMLDVGINIDHACEKSCACTTCHVILRQGFETLEPAEEKEEDCQGSDAQEVADGQESKLPGDIQKEPIDRFSL